MCSCKLSRLHDIINVMKAHIVSLGCPKNLADTELLMGQLAGDGYTFTDDPAEAELILVNTCAFIQSATDEAIATIRELAKYKVPGTRNQVPGKCKYLIAAGCLPQRYKNEAPKLLPEVDAFIGTPQRFHSYKAARVKATPPWFAYVKIAEGCSNRCTYCAVPGIRGPFRARPLNDILKEVALLAGAGVKEVIFVAQDTTAYPHLPKLLRLTAKIPGVRWIRLMYAHPAHISDELLKTIAAEPKIVKYLDLPIQHCNGKILKRMHRRYSRRSLENIIAKIRRLIPNIALRTSVIVGFPGEDEAGFQELLRFVRQVKFERLGAFTYQREKGTPAYRMRGQLPERIKKRRLDRLMRAQALIAQRLGHKMIGRTIEILVEKAVRGGFTGRSSMDAPEIDGSVIVSARRSKTPGEFVQVRVTSARTYDLLGRMT